MAVTDRPPARSTSTSSSSRSRRRPPEVLTEPEAIALIRACSTRAPTGVRKRALIAVLWRSGLRISEALALELRDLVLPAVILVRVEGVMLTGANSAGDGGSQSVSDRVER